MLLLGSQAGRGPGGLAATLHCHLPPPPPRHRGGMLNVPPLHWGGCDLLTAGLKGFPRPCVMGCWDCSWCLGWKNTGEMGNVQKKGAAEMVHGLENLLCCGGCSLSRLNFSSKGSLRGGSMT